MFDALKRKEGFNFERRIFEEQKPNDVSWRSVLIVQE
jgi:hypothetical protein